MSCIPTNLVGYSNTIQNMLKSRRRWCTNLGQYPTRGWRRNSCPPIGWGEGPATPLSAIKNAGGWPGSCGELWEVPGEGAWLSGPPGHGPCTPARHPPPCRVRPSLQTGSARLHPRSIPKKTPVFEKAALLCEGGAAGPSPEARGHIPLCRCLLSTVYLVG